MVGRGLKHSNGIEADTDGPIAPLTQAESFVAGGAVGQLHQRLQQELGMDWDDPIVYAPRNEPIAHKVERRFSTAVGIAALGAGYVAAAKLIF
ncbi:hypothetical protein [Qipengyuania sp.]|uniref:hypothetical protein n=1 Tax=Qipengyuania sp. TaxID=2004515 RepID=UPI003736CCA2